MYVWSSASSQVRTTRDSRSMGVAVRWVPPPVPSWGKEEDFWSSTCPAGTRSLSWMHVREYLTLFLWAFSFHYSFTTNGERSVGYNIEDSESLELFGIDKSCYNNLLCVLNSLAFSHSAWQPHQYSGEIWAQGHQIWHFGCSVRSESADCGLSDTKAGMSGFLSIHGLFCCVPQIQPWWREGKAPRPSSVLHGFEGVTSPFWASVSPLAW